MKKTIRDELYNFGLYKNQIQDLFLWHFDGYKEVAEYFGVHPNTIKNWQKNGNYPLSVVRLMLIKHRGYLPVSKPWREFKIRGDNLITPGGRELSAFDLMELDIKMSLKNTSNVVQFRRKKKNRIKRHRVRKRKGAVT
ncbi:DUF3653 domain-containing protein [Vibrio sp. CyArs1]|uniref:DUF3653 domain-containing protein n=1 Tax=Vibrio sp. CyArs1 TaxID=2682577 RepID=UPI001F051A6F|nr:DUF3653 domain-containing protein [Vibrio sp. CyArs1]